MSAPRKSDIGIALILLLLPLLWFAPQALGDKTLVPADNLFAFEPWHSFADQQGVGVPHNLLISDLVLENHPWKTLIVEALRTGDLTGILWNPRAFGGVPFLAAGQHSALYPLSALFYILPLWRAYGVFTWLQLGLAALGMYVFARVLRMRRTAALLAAIAYAFSGFYMVSVAFTMVIAAAAWLPLILAMIEIVIRKQAEKGGQPYSPAPYIILGAFFLGLEILAGHVEITYYTLMVAAFYAAWRLVGLLLVIRRWRPVLRLAAWLGVMVGLGLALGGAQLIPLYELVRQSFREGSASLQQVRDWAWPSQQILTFLLPDFFGNPTSHSYFDLWQRAWTPVTQNALGQPLNTIDWGVKNYVEGGNYVGVITLLLAGIGISGIGYWVLGKRKYPIPNIQYLVLFATLASLSLLFAFGTPLYAVLYYGLPGYSQLHSAFRWVFPYTLSMAVLAGFGLDRLMADGKRRFGLCDLQFASRLLGGLAALAGAGALLVVLVSVVAPGPFVALGDKLLAWPFWADRAQSSGFANGAMLWSYEAAGIVRFGAMALLAGVALVWASRRQGNKETRKQGIPTKSPRHRVTLSPGHRVAVSLIALLILDLWLFGHNFNTAADPKLLDFKPPVVQWLQDRQDPAQPWRLTSFDAPDEKMFNANSPMPYGLEDVRGYDSIIPKSYVAYMQRIQPQGDLLYNRIAPIYTQVAGQPNYAALDSRLLDLLGVRYIVTTHTIPNPGYEVVYDREVKVYLNRDALPRVFVVGEAVAAPDQAAALDLLQRLDPAQKVVVEGWADGQLPPQASPEMREARIAHRANREVFVDINISDRGWLVFTDAYFDGWKAYLRPFGVEGEGVTASGEPIEQQLPLYRADGAFRAVYLPRAGQWTVRFVYSPRSVLLGLYASFLAGITLLLLAGWWAWGRFYRGARSEAGTVAKNSAVQVVSSLMNRGIDFAFAMLRLRILSPMGQGSYAFAISVYVIFETLTRFGLQTLLTRDVAADRSSASRYLKNVIALRVGLWLLSLPLIALVCLAYWQRGQLSPEQAQAIALLAGALFFANIADALDATFNAFEKMEYTGGLSIAITVAKVALGALVLLPPLSLGFVGLAGVSLVMNVAQMIWLWTLLRNKVLGSRAAEEQGSRGVFHVAGGATADENLTPLLGPVSDRARRGSVGDRPQQAIYRAEGERLDESPTTRRPLRLGLNLGFDLKLQRYMLRESGPLMLNNLLVTVLWRISQFALPYFVGVTALGLYSPGVAWLDGLNVIPAYFTAAIFPLMSRYARSGTDSLVKAYRLAVQLLFITALPLAVFFTFASTALINIQSGAAYLPGAAIALRIMIWSIPIGFINSVTQYALIAVNRQRFLTRAFVIGVTFTAVANLIFVPKYGYLAAAAILLPAELSLFIPFAWAVHKYLAPMNWWALLGRPLLAAVADAGSVVALQRAGAPLFVALVAGFLAYCGALLLLGAFRGDDFAVIRARLPGQLGRNK